VKRFLEYYRQFEELSPEEISSELIQRRHAERAKALTEVVPLDLTSAAWHEPPHAEAINAATYALRRSVNAYPDTAPLREAIAARHGVAVAKVAVGHGARELLRAALRPFTGEVAVAWPGWGHLPRLVDEAGATPVPVEPELEALLAVRASALVVCSPNDPTGALVDVAALAAGLDESVWLIVDAALAEFAPDDDPAALLDARERIVVVRSFSKAHAMAGLRVGYALGDGVAGTGVSAPAQAAALWAVTDGDAVAARRRATAARERERLADALRDTPFSFPAGHGHLVWLSSSEHDGATIASGLAAQRVHVTPGSAWGDDRHVRVALRDAAATDRLSASLREL
jgi:histidinol-phosphate/aromatic aminotransferase/cobyric acid decarboxylase-like protein